jgi:hypothetical protein
MLPFTKGNRQGADGQADDFLPGLLAQALNRVFHEESCRHSKSIGPRKFVPTATIGTCASAVTTIQRR